MSPSMGSGLKIVLVLGITLFSIGAQSAPVRMTRRALVAEAVFDVTQFGAVADGPADASLAFIKTWRATCDAAGAALLRIPKGTFKVGKLIFNGPCKANPIKIDLQGIVLQTKDPSALSGNEPAWFINDVTGLSIFGGGTVDGQGQFLWQYNTGKGDTLLPISLMLSKVKQSSIDNISFVNGKGVHFKVTASDDVMVQNIHVNSPGDSPNTDGIVVSNSNKVTVRNCQIATGDDCIAIGDTNSFIDVSEITCGPGHGLSIGSLGKRLNEGDVRHVRIANSTLKGTTNGVRIKTYMGSHALEVQDIVFEDIIMDAVKNPVLIDQSYMTKTATAPSKVHITDVHFRNIRGSTISPIPVSLGCSKSTPCEGIELNNIDLTPVAGAQFIRGPLMSECVNSKFSIMGAFPTNGCGGRAEKSQIPL